MNAQKHTAARQSPLIDSMILDTFVIGVNAGGMLVLAAVGLWMLEHPNEVDN